MKNTVVLSFGRMNPMTNGHEKLADKIKSEASKRNADAKLYLSHSTNPKKDPLDFNTKVKFAKKAFGPMVQNSPARTIIEVAKELTGKYDNLVVVVGSDRIPEFKSLLTKYNGKDYDFKSIEIVSAGERDPDAEGVEGMSGSKMRGFVASGDISTFKKGVPSKLSNADAEALFNAVKRGMKLAEELELDEAVLSLSARRGRAQRAKRMARRLAFARAMQMKRFADTGRLRSRAMKAAYKSVRSRLAGGKNYAELGSSEKIQIDQRLQRMLPAIKKIAARLIPQERKLELMRKQNALKNAKMVKKEDVNFAFKSFLEEKPQLPQDKDVSGKEGTQPKKYYVGMDKDTKEKRAAHFASTGPKSDSDPNAYKDAPGDKEAREKGMPQSKHTKKYKDMFGEAIEKKQLGKLDMLVRMGLADKTLLSTIKRAVTKLETGDVLSPQERTATNDLLTTLLDMVLNSDQLFRLTRVQLQKESLEEASYEGNVGAMEMVKFFQMATPGQKQELKKLIADKKKKEAWGMVQKITGTKLVGKQFNEQEEDEYDEIELDGLQMAKLEVANLIDDSEDLLDMLDSMEEEPEAWVTSKITRAADYVNSVVNYIEFEDEYNDEEEDDGEEESGDDELDAELMGMEPEDFGDAYEEFKPILEEIEGLKKKAEKSGISYSILKQVYNRGMAAWQGGHRPGTTPQQWAFARVNSFITGGKTRTTADADLWKKVNEALEWGTDHMRMVYARTTPGQSDEIVTASYSADKALEMMNNANRQRLFKLYSEEKKDDSI